MALQVTLNRESLVYNYGETIQGQVAVLNQTNQAHAGLRVTVTGSLHLTPGKKDRVEQTFTLLKKSKELLPAGKVMGNTEVDFSLQLIPESGFELYETYQCVMLPPFTLPFPAKNASTDSSNGILLPLPHSLAARPYPWSTW